MSGGSGVVPLFEKSSCRIVDYKYLVITLLLRVDDRSIVVILKRREKKILSKS